MWSTPARTGLKPAACTCHAPFQCESRSAVPDGPEGHAGCVQIAPICGRSRAKLPEVANCLPSRRRIRRNPADIRPMWSALGPNAIGCGPNWRRYASVIDRKHVDGEAMSAEFGRGRPAHSVETARIWTIPGQNWPSSSGVAKACECGAVSAKVRRNWVKSGQDWPKSGQSWSHMNQLLPNPRRFGHSERERSEKERVKAE